MDREGIIAARTNGQSLRTVAKEFGMSLTTVQRLLKEAAL
ncbi:helix-turn-helix domain-containing protein [Citrobacter freundii]|nr:helix-turn-helix domain-containing protein [Citrobacter freundii]